MPYLQIGLALQKFFWREQLRDKNSIQKHKDGSMRIFSKCISKSTTEITQDILHTIDIKCSEKLFKDVVIGAKEFNEFNNQDSAWKSPNKEKLILGVIN